jgi:phospholipid transport system substrate-binding protein
MVRRALLLIIAALCTAMATWPAPARALEPDAAVLVVNNAVKDAIGAFAGKKLAREEMRRTADQLIQRYSDRQQLSEQVLGRYWTRASVEEQAKFQGMIIDYMVAFWGGQMSDVSNDQKITVTGSERQGDRVVVHTLSTEPGEAPTPVDFVVGAARDGRAVILDLLAQGVSPVKTMRDDFTAVLRSNSGRMDLLMGAMQKKIAAAQSG